MQGLLDIARAFLQAARSELEEGLTENNYVKVREAAEKAWNAVVQATDHAMNAHGRIPGPGAFVHRSRRTFLEGVGRMDLASDYTYFAERLHGDVFYAGESIPAETARRLLDEVEDYIRKVSTL